MPGLPLGITFREGKGKKKMGPMNGVEGAVPSGEVEKKTRSFNFKKIRVGSKTLVGLVAIILLSVSQAGPLMGQTGGTPVREFNVETAQGSFTFSEHRGEIPVYFFSFPG